MTRPRPVLTANAIAGAVTGLAGVLAFLGYANASTQLSGEAQGIGGAIAFLAPLLIHLGAGHVGQQQVTPLASPVAADGTPLAPAGAAVRVRPDDPSADLVSALQSISDSNSDGPTGDPA